MIGPAEEGGGEAGDAGVHFKIRKLFPRHRALVGITYEENMKRGGRG